jgi:hypothetical protein
MRWKRMLVCFIVLVAAAAGCRTLNVEKSFEVSAVGEHNIALDPIRTEQKIKVVVTSTAPVSAFVFLEPDTDDVRKAVMGLRKSPKMLASSEKKEDATLEATIPANSTAVVMVVGTGKSATVKVRITN